jgi:hypothetical protein
LADARNGLEKLQGLVLELAIRGKLSEQSDDDQNDSGWHQPTEKLDGEYRRERPEIDRPFEIPIQTQTIRQRKNGN